MFIFSSQFLLGSGSLIGRKNRLYTYDGKQYILASNQYTAYRTEILRKVDHLLAEIRLKSPIDLDKSSIDLDNNKTLYLRDQNQCTIFEGSEVLGTYIFTTRDESWFVMYPELAFLFFIVKCLKDDEELIIPSTIYGEDGYPVQDRNVSFKIDSNEIIGSSSSNQNNPIFGFAPFKRQNVASAIRLKH